MELELKAGHVQALVAFAATLAENHPLKLDFESKSDRGNRLSQGADPAPCKARPLTLSASATLDQLIGATLQNALAQFVGNWAALRETDQPESIHQLRVALRRMRSILGVFKKAVASPEIEDIRQEAKRIATALGPARECDVFLKNASEGPWSTKGETIVGAATLLELVRHRRQLEFSAARQLIDSQAATLFVLKVQGFLARRGWRSTIPHTSLGLLTTEAKQFAADALHGLHRRVLKRGKALPDLTDEQRHDVRIALKKLRYALEFFASLFPQQSKTKKYLKGVAALQELLGAHNDAATARHFLSTFGEEAAGAESRHAAGYFLSWYGHAMRVADDHLIEEWRHFKKAKIPWS